MKKKFQSFVFEQQILHEDDFGKKIFLTQEVEESLQQGVNVVKLYILFVLLFFLKLGQTLGNYATPIVLNEMVKLYESRTNVTPYNETYLQYQIRLMFIYLILAGFFQYVTARLFSIYQTRFQILTNAYLSKILYEKCLKLYANINNQQMMTFQGMLKELRQIDNATGSFYTLIRVFFELLFGGYYLTYQINDQSNTIFRSLKYGVLVSLLALGAATFAQIYAWRIQYFSDRKLKLTQDIIVGMKNIKYMQWEDQFEKKLHDIRKDEFKGIAGVQYAGTFITFFRQMTSVVLMFVTFYSLETLPQTQFYTILIFFDSFTYPLNTFPWCFGEFLGSFISFIRIRDYLNQPEVLAQNRITDQGDISEMITFPKNKAQTFNIINKTINYLAGNNMKQNEQKDQFQLNAQVNIKKNGLYMIIGKVGSGKTAFLDCLLGEMANSTILQSSNVSYVGQNPCIFSESIRQNILFGSEYQEQFYQQCLYCSDLLNDINEFPEKDLKAVGVNGTNLSGGQKQRLAICRALYNRADIYIFDDIISSFDEHVADMIMERSIRTLLKGKLIFLALSQYQYLHYADSILEIKDNQINQIYPEDKMFDLLTNSRKVQHHATVLTQNQIIEEPTKSEQTHSKEESQYLESTEMKLNYKYYLSTLTKSSLLMFVATQLTYQTLKGSFELWTHSYIFSLVGGIKPFLLYDDFKLTFLIFFLSLGGFTFLRASSYTFIVLQSASQIFSQLIYRFLRMPIKCFDNNSQTYFIRRIFNDMENIDDLPLYGFLQSVLDIISLISYHVKKLSYIVGQFVQQVFILLQTFKSNKGNIVKSLIRNLSSILEQIYKISMHLYKKHRSIELHILYFYSRGLKTIRSFRKQALFYKTFTKILRFRYFNRIVEDQLDYYIAFHRKLIQYGVFLLLVLVQVLQSEMFQDFDSIKHCLTITYAYRLFAEHSISSTVCSCDRVIRTSETIQRLRQIIEAKIEDSTVSVKKIEDQEIVFNNVWLNYSLSKDQEDNKVFALKGVSFHIRKGEKVAFCGRTGSGKSSLFNLLVKLYDYQEGEILFNHENIKNLSTNIRSQMSVIPQNGFLFQGTLLANLNPRGDKDPKEIIAFLKQYNLLSERMSQIIDNGEISTFQVEQCGDNLSSGEKQIINFVQQILEMKPVVCMDEATSNMDPKTNDNVMNALFKVIKNNTLLLISHRLENLQQFDRIYVLQQGCIVGEGTYESLMKDNKVFRELKSNIQ